MRTLFYVIFCVFVFLACRKSDNKDVAQHGLPVLDTLRPLANQARTELTKATFQKKMTLRIHRSLPLFNFCLFSDSAFSQVDSIQISIGEDSTIVQTIPGELGVPPFLALQDVDFDGYQDLELGFTQGAHGNTSYNYWIFDSSSRRFVPNEDLDGLISPGFNRKDRTITSYWVGGTYWHEVSKYRFVHHKLVLFEESEEKLDEETHIVTETVKKLKKDSMVIVSKKTWKAFE